MNAANDRIWHDWEEDLYEAKRKLSAEIEGMTPEEHIAYLKAKTDPVIKQFNMKISTLQPVIPYVRKRIGEEVLIRYE